MSAKFPWLHEAHALVRLQADGWNLFADARRQKCGVIPEVPKPSCLRSPTAYDPSKLHNLPLRAAAMNSLLAVSREPLAG